MSSTAARALPDIPAASADGRLIYAIGDIHGRYDVFKDLLRFLLRDWIGRAGQRRPDLIFCGDYIDRGPDSSAVIEALLWLSRREDLSVTLLRGNHEQALLDFLEDPIASAPWLQHGGDATLRSYGVIPPAMPTPGELTRARDALLERMPAAHLHLLQRMELTRVIGDYLFVHAGIRYDRPIDAQDKDDLLWIRRDFIDRIEPFEKIVVHGHSWRSDQVELLPHRIGIDTGCYMTGVLSAVRIEDMGASIIQARPHSA